MSFWTWVAVIVIILFIFLIYILNKVKQQYGGEGVIGSTLTTIANCCKRIFK